MNRPSNAISPTQSSFGASEYPDSVLVDDKLPQIDAHGKPIVQTTLSTSWAADLLVYSVITILVLAVWHVSKMRLFEAGDDTGYWLGVAGGTMMVLLFTYPLRKHFKFTRKWGRVKWWFVVHMLLGVGGPLLILLHSTFRVGSLNAAVALYSMLAVAISGVIGRFIYARVSRGLHGEKASLKDLQRRAGMQQENARSRLAFAPEVEAQLKAFELKELNSSAGWLTYFRQVFWLPVQQWMVYKSCSDQLRRTLRTLAKRNSWTASDFVTRKKHAKLLVRQYLDSVTRVAQYNAYERMFSLWHIAHIPFVYLLVLSAVVHVVAVHAY
jgi:hypothetical protein